MSQNGVRMVIGANRGIGLALTAGQLRDPRVTRVIATHRQDADVRQLSLLSRQHGEKLRLHALDVADSKSLEAFSRFLEQQQGGIDISIHAAGILHEEDIQPEKSFTQCRAESLLRMFEINSIGDNRLGGWYGYRASKAALNQFIKTLSIECRTRYPNASVVAIHPGTTDTDLSRPYQNSVKPGKLYTPEQTAARLLSVIEAINLEQSGNFLNWDGKPISW